MSDKKENPTKYFVHDVQSTNRIEIGKQFNEVSKRTEVLYKYLDLPYVQLIDELAKITETKHKFKICARGSKNIKYLLDVIKRMYRIKKNMFTLEVESFYIENETPEGVEKFDTELMIIIDFEKPIIKTDYDSLRFGNRRLSTKLDEFDPNEA